LYHDVAIMYIFSQNSKPNGTTQKRRLSLRAIMERPSCSLVSCVIFLYSVEKLFQMIKMFHYPQAKENSDD
jgi:hypothetical protein